MDQVITIGLLGQVQELASKLTKVELGNFTGADNFVEVRHKRRYRLQALGYMATAEAVPCLYKQHHMHYSSIEVIDPSF